MISRGELGEWKKMVESTVGEVENILKVTTMESIEAVDEIEKLEEQEIFIYKNLISNEAKGRY